MSASAWRLGKARWLQPIEMLLGFMASHPGAILVAGKRFESTTPGVAKLLEMELRQAH
jgi:hypothetical protein